MANDPYFKNKRIGLIESNPNKQRDRTWSFWGRQDHPYSDLAQKKWDKIKIHDGKNDVSYSTLPFYFYTLNSQDFYNDSKNKLAKAGIEIIIDKILSVTDEGAQVKVTTQSGKIFLAAKVFSSLFNTADIEKQNRFPCIKQHFVGWWVETEKPVFDQTTATFMDFSVPQNGQTRFMYVLPMTPHKALVEYTLFTENLLSKETYESAITAFLKKINAGAFSILEQEQGNIPMTAYRFDQKNSKNLLFIGTAGGWTKASTGFTFSLTQKKVPKLIKFLKKEEDFRKFNSIGRFWFYDLLLLDVLHQNNALGSRIFSEIFKKNPASRVLRFLDEETQWIDELKIINSCPKKPFLKAFLKRLVRFSF